MGGVLPLLLGAIMATLACVSPSVGLGAGDGPHAAAPGETLDRRPEAPAAEPLPLTEGSRRMDEPMKSRPEYAWLREFKATHGWDLMQRYGAHGLGIGWKRENGRKTDRLALVFYVDRKSPSDQAAAGPPIPPAFAFTPPGSDAPVQLPTDVVETPAATLEAE
jgi:hypothetical protein